MVTVQTAEETTAETNKDEDECPKTIQEMLSWLPAKAFENYMANKNNRRAQETLFARCVP